ncbi:hypothetical protein [Brevibacillus invocatus]|uniref:Uncharacterized protein n=1 Tax=Brevibacillus invocatus TaxID=173959 RepID=A0A3M8CMP2_9BACL|nr:hypothetical protein [Brevibacillus invocatus]MCM3080048.1 hypothetical protein [Brevibacillus invocatus]MCM3430241.1 hypothetical protein [Brevibacillus invocatus]RNB76913.1 hypothetical protein EDM52_01615 [Brevibacillus invocatus]
MNTMYAFRWPEEDVEICSPESGSLALNEWIFSTQIQGKIFAPVLLDYLDNKMSIKSTSYFSLMEYALELIDFFKTRYGLDARSIQNKELANKDALINFIEHSSYNFVQRDMILAIARKLISNGFELKKSTNGISTKKRTKI